MGLKQMPHLLMLGQLLLRLLPLSLLLPHPIHLTLRKKKGKGKLKLGETPIPLEEAQSAKRAKTFHSPLPSCSLRLSNRGGRGVRGRPKGMKGLGQEKRKSEKKSINSVTDLKNLCDVIISPSKELELAEGRHITTDLGVFSKTQGGGGWPRTATRGS